MTTIARISTDGVLTVNEYTEGDSFMLSTSGGVTAVDLEELDEDKVSFTVDGKIVCRELVEEDIDNG
jgi:hypothetical protein